MKIDKKYEPIIGLFGNVFVWYSFALFMPFLPIISKQFFPISGNEGLGHVLSLLAVSVALFVRPLGASIFGPIGDKFGRAKAIALSILVMVVSTFAIALIPGYDSIGIAAPILLIFFRALQGISLGGEYTSVMVHAVENAPANRRGFYGSFTDFGNQIGVLFGGQFLVLLYSFFSVDQIYDFAWRIPFLCSLVLLPFMFMLPDNIPEKSHEKKEPLLPMLSAHKKEMLGAFFITAFSAVSFYTLLTFLPYYLHSIGALSLDDTARCSNFACIAMSVAILAGGYLSDKFGRKPFLYMGILGGAATLVVMLTSSSKDMSFWMTTNGVFGVLLGFYYSSRSAFFAEAFPKKIRCTAVSVSFSLAQAIFGGLTPTVILKLTQFSRECAVIPVLFVTIAALIALSQLKDRTGEDLR